MLVGNAIILKPASAVPLASLLFARIFELSGFPKEDITTIIIKGRDMNTILKDRRIHCTSFTESTKLGIQILQTAGIKSFHMELGGKDPAIVLKDCDFEKRVEKLTKELCHFLPEKEVFISNQILNLRSTYS